MVLGGIVAELLYFIIRQWPQHWWLMAWAVFMGLFVAAGAIGAGRAVSDFLQVCAVG